MMHTTKKIGFKKIRIGIHGPTPTMFFSVLLALAAATCSDSGDGNQSTDQGTDQSTDQSTDQGTDQSTDQGTDQSTDQDTDQGADQGTDQSTDQGANPCATCAADELCVQSFDGTCNTGGATCEKVSSACIDKKGTPGAACAAECQAEYCGSTGPFQCVNQPSCGTETSGVDIYCYGP